MGGAGVTFDATPVLHAPQNPPDPAPRSAVVREPGYGVSASAAGNLIVMSLEPFRDLAVLVASNEGPIAADRC